MCFLVISEAGAQSNKDFSYKYRADAYSDVYMYYWILKMFSGPELGYRAAIRYMKYV